LTRYSSRHCARLLARFGQPRCQAILCCCACKLSHLPILSTRGADSKIPL
jgi:hypothetical protein